MRRRGRGVTRPEHERGFVDHPSWRGWLRPWRPHLGAPGWLVVVWWALCVLAPVLVIPMVLVEGYLAWASDWDSIDLAPRELGMTVVACLAGAAAYAWIPGWGGRVVYYGSAVGMGALLLTISIDRTRTRPVFEVLPPAQAGGRWRVWGRRRGEVFEERETREEATVVCAALNRAMSGEGRRYLPAEERAAAPVATEDTAERIEI